MRQASDNGSSEPVLSTIDHDPFGLNRVTVESLRLSMIFSENRLPLFGIVLSLIQEERDLGAVVVNPWFAIIEC